MVTLLNLGSLVFGILSWVIPGLALMLQNKKKISGVLFMFISFILMGISLLFQLMVQQALIAKNDTVAIMDTIDGVVMVSLVLLVGTILANATLLRALSKNRSI